MPSIKNKKTALITRAIFVFQLLVLSGCGSHSAGSGELDLQLQQEVKQQGWSADPANPIIKAGDFLDKGLWNDPHVMKEGKQYVMYFTTSTAKNPFKPPILPYRAVSKDGLKWKLAPAKALMDASGTPFASIETPSVVKFKGLYHMFYTGVYAAGKPLKFSIGHAVSKDGINWKKDPTEALKPTGNPTEWNGQIIGEPGAVVYKNAIHVYFTAVGHVPGGTPSISQSIGLVTTTDGKSFSTPKIALQLSPRYANKRSYAGYSTPMAVVNKGTLHLFHDIVVYSKNLDPNWQQVALGHAVSKDGGIHFEQDEHPIFNRNDFDWTTGEIRSPSALFEKGKLRLWFAGMVPPKDFRPMIERGIKGREFGIGHAVINADQLSGTR